MALPPTDKRRSYGCSGEAYASILACEYGWSNPDVHDANYGEGKTFTVSDERTGLGILIQTVEGTEDACMVVITDADSNVAIVEPTDGFPTPDEADAIFAARSGSDLVVTPWWYDVTGI